MPLPRLLMVVTGDDFGYCPRRNQGIVECFLAGGISNVSLLVNASAAKEAAGLARRHKIPIGLHANLSEGTPVYQQLQQISTLINPQGFFHGKMGFRQALEKGQLSMNQVELELRAQVRRFIELTGHLPHHMDGHQHVHVLPGGQTCTWDSPPWVRTCQFQACRGLSSKLWELELLTPSPEEHLAFINQSSQQSSWFIQVTQVILMKVAVGRAQMTSPSLLKENMSSVCSEAHLSWSFTARREFNSVVLETFDNCCHGVVQFYTCG
ncbi:carbohydrate deacetylase isoform X2 [Poeciliopsis prolifica]|uniref:carbohydrate deacetylase isoform X2 n=1 Tax=Poeciliopsis prolifica TaxID=188132 RepID=UPI00241417D7|nr:carbohydrate deacetylase isoform X2 [Poeciliopsis prolifica]